MSIPAKKDTKSQLGKGIGALLSGISSDYTLTAEQQEKKETAAAVNLIPLAKIKANPYQPRTEFDENALMELATSIEQHGIIQPITLRKLGEDEYQIISGERRWRASKLAGLKEVPAYVRTADDNTMLEMALIENIQREDLNAIEVALSYHRLLEECAITQEQLSDRVGKDRSTIANYLRLIKLPPDIQKGLKERKLTMGHARAILGTDDIAIQLMVYKEVVEKGLSVRAVESLVKEYQKPKSKTNKVEGLLPPAYKKIQDNLCSRYETKVLLKRKTDGKGEITIPFYNDNDLNRILEILEGSE